MTTIRRRAQLRPSGPNWIAELKAGRAPERGTKDWAQFCDWYFFSERVEGLPPWDSDEGKALIAALPESTWTAKR